MKDISKEIQEIQIPEKNDLTVGEIESIMAISNNELFSVIVNSFKAGYYKATEAEKRERR